MMCKTGTDINLQSIDARGAARGPGARARARGRHRSRHHSQFIIISTALIQVSIVVWRSRDAGVRRTLT